MEWCDMSRHSVVPPITPNQVIYFPLTECLVKVTEVLRGHALLFLPFLFSHHHEFSLSQHDKNCVHMHHLILENESFTMWNSVCIVFWVFLLNWLSWNSFAVYSHIHNTPAVVILLWHSVSSGVPQGTSLGPLSFLPVPPPGLSERSPKGEFFFIYI